ncbi:hypothetical protein DFJ74DRAFT_218320 [Hyaloraphidium curvatum]|nr:hypothetical protein DFJ74DRAFT_218320 [Hyaloraphidium curvatum]
MARKAVASRLNARRQLVTPRALYPWTLPIAVLPVASEEQLSEVTTGAELNLGIDVVNAFARTVSTKLSIFSQAGASSTNPRVAVFTRSLKFVSFVLSSSGFDAARLVMFNDLLLLVADAAAKELKAFLGEEGRDPTDEEHDTLFLQVMDLVVSSLREAIYSVDPRSPLVAHSSLRHYKPQLARFLRSASSILEEAEAQPAGAGVRLVDWCRVLFGTDVDLHNKECVEARRIATKKNVLLDLRSYIAKLEDPERYLAIEQDQFSSPQAFQNWRKGERKYATGLVNSLVLRYPDLQGALVSRVAR